MKTKIGVVSLGCDKNRVDTEVMLSNLKSGGFEITPDPKNADVIIVNTCAFLEAARKEAIETILEMSRYKLFGNCKKIVVTGCLGQKYGDELLSALDEADAIVGANDYGRICEIVEKTLNGERNLYKAHNDSVTFGDRILTTAPHVAYLKIADGCNNYCSYCLIPYIKGKYRSVEMDDIVAHAEKLVEQGVKELILVAQDTTKYGEDLYGESKLTELIRRLSKIEELKWIRILYAYPELIGDELLDEITDNEKVVKYVDIPLQHVNADILKKMNRKTTTESLLRLFDKLTERNINVRSTFICGFPGESGATVKEIETFLKEYKLRNVGFFAYSREEGTPASKMENQVSERLKKRYVKELYQAQFKIVSAMNKSEIGKTIRCIVDGADSDCASGNVYLGRTEYMTPEIDGVVKIHSDRNLIAGTFCDVLITGADGYDLKGEAK